MDTGFVLTTLVGFNIYSSKLGVFSTNELELESSFTAGVYTGL